jgi:hypothetical protein
MTTTTEGTGTGSAEGPLRGFDLDNIRKVFIYQNGVYMPCIYVVGSAGTERSSVFGSKWNLILNGLCTVGDTLDIQDCDSTGGNWFKAPQSIYQLSNYCTTTENARCILP